MAVASVSLHSGKMVSATNVLYWRMVQTLFWLVGAALLTCLLFFPPLGTLLFWNILIPVAPALLVIAPGVWRNVCPLAATVLLPRHLNISRRKKITLRQSGWLNLAGVLALFAIVPLRHPLFNQNGPATGLLIICMAITGWILGWIFEWKSAWCSGLCPVHPVEKLYGNNPMGGVPNMHCGSCKNCTVPCPDSTPAMHSMLVQKDRGHQLAGWLITGGLPGFIWGWFHVPDSASLHWLPVYGFPLAGMSATLLCFYIARDIVKAKQEKTLVRIFAFLSVSCYYWYRIPSLLGAGEFAADGVLVDLHTSLTFWMIPLLRTLVTGFFAWWLLVRKAPKNSWSARPAFDL